MGFSRSSLLNFGLAGFKRMFDKKSSQYLGSLPKTIHNLTLPETQIANKQLKSHSDNREARSFASFFGGKVCLYSVAVGVSFKEAISNELPN